MILNKEKMNYVESLITVFTVDKGDLKVLLIRKKTEPYKGYWILPGNVLDNNETLEDNISDAVFEQLGLTNVYIEQSFTTSQIDRNPEERIIATSFLGLVDIVTAQYKREEREEIESEWFKITDLPKLGYDHNIIINKNLNFFKRKIVNSNILRILFPSDFTLPEIQRVYEQILDKKLDRRNFRKKFISLDLIEYTNEKNTGFNGRPANLYRFKDEMKDITLF
ncbi:MAG: NUDIX domain-containing protein [Bacilli bacterium]|nr:NUDIX domain-containing protein [Bacilli bacterium]MDD4733473.1 NUDIX domain-containing protein [Bacilli bacterium]